MVSLSNHLRPRAHDDEQLQLAVVLECCHTELNFSFMFQDSGFKFFSPVMGLLFKEEINLLIDLLKFRQSL